MTQQPDLLEQDGLERSFQPNGVAAAQVRGKEPVPAAPIWTQQSRKYANQHEALGSVMQTTRHAAITTALADAREEERRWVKLMSKPLYACRLTSASRTFSASPMTLE